MNGVSRGDVLTLTFQLDFRTFQRNFRHVLLRSRNFWSIVAADVLLGFMAIEVLDTPTKPFWVKLVASGGVGASFALAGVVFLLLVSGARKATLQTPSLLEPVSMTFDDDGYHATTTHFSLVTDWTTLAKFTEHGEFVSFQRKGAGGRVMIPKSAFNSPEEMVVLRRLFSERTVTTPQSTGRWGGRAK